jgi:hypothetical protein
MRSIRALEGPTCFYPKMLPGGQGTIARGRLAAFSSKGPVIVTPSRPLQATKVLRLGSVYHDWKSLFSARLAQDDGIGKQHVCRGLNLGTRNPTERILWTCDRTKAQDEGGFEYCRPQDLLLRHRGAVGVEDVVGGDVVVGHDFLGHFIYFRSIKDRLLDGFARFKFEDVEAVNG